MVNRAKQFAPFAALKGYYDLVREQERQYIPRHELSEEEIAQVSAVLSRVEKGDMVTVRYYDTDAYVTKIGVVTQVEAVFHSLTVVKTHIRFEDILEISREGDDPVDEWPIA